MSKEYIEREAALQGIENEDDPHLDDYYRAALLEASMIVKNLPAADVAPVVHGEWVFINQATNYLEPPHGDTCGCSVCGYEIDVSDTYRFRYCPICGAKMNGGK